MAANVLAVNVFLVNRSLPALYSLKKCQKKVSYILCIVSKSASHTLYNTLSTLSVLLEVYRCMHGMPLMAWDDAVEENVRAWVSQGSTAHSARSRRALALTVTTQLAQVCKLGTSRLYHFWLYQFT